MQKMKIEDLMKVNGGATDGSQLKDGGTGGAGSNYGGCQPPYNPPIYVPDPWDGK